MRGPMGQRVAAGWAIGPGAWCCLIVCGQRVWEDARALPPQGQGAAAGDTEAGVSLGGTHAAPTDGPPRGPSHHERGCSGGEGAVGAGTCRRRRRWC